MSRLTRHFTGRSAPASGIRRIVNIAFVALALFLIGLFVASLLAGCGGERRDEKSGQGEKRQLVRNGPYYEITGDGDDYGNYFETYRVPTPNGDVFCIVYSDKIGDSGGGAGLSCDWGEER